MVFPLPKGKENLIYSSLGCRYMEKRGTSYPLSTLFFLATVILVVSYLLNSPWRIYSPSEDVSSSSAGAVIATFVPTVTVTAPDSSAAEMGTNGTVSTNTGRFTITRTGSTTTPLAVYYRLSGTATNGGNPTTVKDYLTLMNTTIIPAGASSADILVKPVEDTISSSDLFVEATETAVLTLSPHSSYLLGTPKNATITISEDDPLPSAGLNPPTSLKLMVATHNFVNLTWTDNSNEQTFRIYRAWAGNNYVYGQLNFVGANVNIWTDPGVSQSQWYFYRIAAQDAASKKTYSNDLAVLTPPMPPLNLAATVLPGPRVNVTWIDLAINEDGFRIERSTNNVNFMLINMTAPQVRSYVDSSVALHTTYYYRGITVKDGLMSVPSNVATAVIP